MHNYSSSRHLLIRTSVHTLTVFVVFSLIALFLTQLASAQAPDHRILFISDRDGTWQLYTMRFDGTDVQPFLQGVYDHIGRIGTSALSPDGSKLALVARTATMEYLVPDLFLLDIASGEIITLSSSLQYESGYPVWSPDETHLLYMNNGVNGAYGDVYIYDLATDEHHFVTDSFIRRADGSILTLGAIYDIDWSPSGERFVLALQVPLEENDANNILVVMDVDGSNPQIITPSEITFLDPLWGNDPNIIYGHCYHKDEEHDNICQVSLQTGQIQKLTPIDTSTTPVQPGRSLFIHDMKMLPDGQIAFQLLTSNVYLYNQQTGIIIQINDPNPDGPRDKILGWVDLSLVPTPPPAPAAAKSPP